MKIFKVTVAVFSLFAALSSFALNFYPQEYIQNPTAAQKKVKWSNTTWGNSHDFATNMPKGMKPGPFDEVHMRHYGQTLTVDEDVSIGTLGLGMGGLFEATKRHIKVRYNIHMPTAVGKNRMRLDNCTLEVGRFWEFWVPEGGFDQAIVDLIDTTATVKGDLYSIFYNVGADYKINNPCGPRINLTGKTTLSIAGVILDDFYRTQAANLTFKFTFTEKDGNVPSLRVTKRADLKDCTFDLVLTPSLKPGRYPIIFHENRQSPADYPKFMVNGSRHVIGDEISVGGKTAVLEFEGKDRNSQDKNCLVLVVK